MCLYEMLWMQLLLARDCLNLNIRNGANVGAMASSPDAGDRLPLGYDYTKLQGHDVYGSDKPRDPVEQNLCTILLGLFCSMAKELC